MQVFFKLIVTIVISIFIIACDKQHTSTKENSDFFITENAVSGIEFSKLINAPNSLPVQINGCEAIYLERTDDIYLQCSKKGFNYTNKQVQDALSKSAGFNFTEEFGQFNYKWKSGNIDCSIAIEEGNDIFELWLRKST